MARKTTAKKPVKKTAVKRRTVATVSKELDIKKVELAEVSANYETLKKESSAAATEMLSSMSNMSAQMMALKLENENLKVENSKKANFIEKLVNIYQNMTRDWQNTPRAFRFWVAVRYITKFLDVFKQAFTEENYVIAD
jgi:hypothetical protein